LSACHFGTLGLIPVVDRVIMGERFSLAPSTVDAKNLSSRRRCDKK